MSRTLVGLAFVLALAALSSAHNIIIESHEIPLVINTYGRYSQNSSMFFWPAFDTTKEWWDLTQYPGGLWTRLGLRAPTECRPPALDSMKLDPPDPQVCEMDTLGNNTNQWVFFYKNQFGLYCDGIDFTQGEYRFIGNYRPDGYTYATPTYHTASWNTSWQWRYELFPGVFIVFNEQHQKKIVSKGKVKIPMSGEYYWPCLVIRDYMVFSDNMGNLDTRWIYEWLVPGHFAGGNGVAAAMSQNGAAHNFLVVENFFSMSNLQIPGWDLIPPTFSNVRVWPDTTYAGPFKVWANIADNQAVGAESLFYRVNQGTWYAKAPDSSTSGRYCFTIPEVTPPAQVEYFIWAKDTFSVNQNIDFWTTWPVCAPESASIRFNVTAVGMTGQNQLRPGDCRLEVSPNPFRNTVQFSLARYGTDRAEVSIYDAAGVLVRRLPMTFDHGTLLASWDGTDYKGASLPSGAYVYQVRAKGYAETGKLLFNR
ncbi:MAG: FlgD immunoglobulin-like domain containing protein [candidate division WOR-3 bacterium]